MGSCHAGCKGALCYLYVHCNFFTVLTFQSHSARIVSYKAKTGDSRSLFGVTSFSMRPTDCYLRIGSVYSAR